MNVLSPAKLNLFLAVLGRRPDGQHDVDTTIVSLDLCDRLQVVRADGDATFELSGPAASPDVPADASNLAVRASRKVAALAPGPVDVALRLEKHVPSRAGLGGGSSNAAAAAWGTARLLGLDPDAEAIARLLAELGADCAFFLRARESGYAHCTGRGELVEPLELPPSERAFLVLTPETTCSTAAVYAAWREEDCPAGRAKPDPEVWFRAPLAEARAALRNDLEEAALRSHPELAAWRRFLAERDGGHFRLCGSGSSLFGLFEDASAAEAFLEEHIVPRKGRNDGLRAAFVAVPRGAGVGP